MRYLLLKKGGLLSIKPELANECKCWQWEKFDVWDWSDLIEAQPQLWIYSQTP